MPLTLRLTSGERQRERFPLPSSVLLLLLLLLSFYFFCYIKPGLLRRQCFQLFGLNGYLGPYKLAGETRWPCMHVSARSWHDITWKTYISNKHKSYIYILVGGWVEPRACPLTSQQRHLSSGLESFHAHKCMVGSVVLVCVDCRLSRGEAWGLVLSL